MGAKAALPQGVGRQGQRLCSLGEGPAGAKAAYILRKPNLPVRVMFIISFI